QQGTVDAQENPVSNFYSGNFYEVQDYLNMTNHQYMPLPVAISDEFWNDLTSEQQEVIQNSADEAAQHHRNLTLENEETLLEEIEAQGVEVVHPDTEVFKEQTEPVYEAFRQQFGDDLLD